MDLASQTRRDDSKDAGLDIETMIQRQVVSTFELVHNANGGEVEEQGGDVI